MDETGLQDGLFNLGNTTNLGEFWNENHPKEGWASSGYLDLDTYTATMAAVHVSATNPLMSHWICNFV